MNQLEAKKHFWELCETANTFEERNPDLPSLEPYLMEILLFVKKNPDNVDLFRRCFVELATNHRFTKWIVLYCMLELKYAEVQNAVNTQFKNLGGPKRAARLMSFMSDINHVYGDKIWEDADFFKYHWRREHPGEIWSCNRNYKETDKFKVISEDGLNEYELAYYPVWSEHYDYEEIDEIVGWGLNKDDVLESFKLNEQGNKHCLYTLLEFNPFPERMRIFIKARILTNNDINLNGYIMNGNVFCLSVFFNSQKYHFSRHPMLSDMFNKEAKRLSLALNIKTDIVFPMKYETDFFSKSGERIRGLFGPSVTPDINK